MREYREDYGHEGKPTSNYYEQKFIIYLEVAESNLYTEEEQRRLFRNHTNKSKKSKNNK